MVKRIIFSVLIIVLAIIGSGLCVYHYGMGVQPYYKEKLEDVNSILGGFYWLEDETVVEQLFENNASYMTGVDLILIGTGEEGEGTLYVQLCDGDGNVLSQKRSFFQNIEDGEYLAVRFLNDIDVSNYNKLILRIFAENNNVVPGLVAVAPLAGAEDSILCSINGEEAEFNLAVNYLYGKRKYVGYEWKSNGVKVNLAVSIFLIFLFSFIIILLIYNKKRIDLKAFASSWKRDIIAAVDIIKEITPNKKNVKYLCYLIGIILYFVSFLGALVFPSLTYLTYQRIAREGFIISLFLTVLADLFFIIGRKFISNSTKQQMISMYIIVAAFFVPMFVRSLVSAQNKIYGNYNWIELIIIVIGLLFWGGQFIGVKPSINLKKQPLILVLIILTVLGLAFEQLAIVIKGDSVEYYSKIVRICCNFSFSPNDISLLKSAGHGCYSYSLFSTIGENIFPYFGLGVRIENIAIWVICIILMWKILKRLNYNISLSILAGCVSIFAFTPLILGNIQEISVEIYGLLFFMLFLYFNISNKHILEMFFAICFVFAKEPNVLILAGYYLGIFINQSIKCIKNKRLRFLEKNFIFSSISIYTAIVIFCLYFVVDVTWGVNSSFNYSKVTQGNAFGVNGILIISKLKQLFVMNFAWIPSVTIIIYLILCKLNKRKIGVKNKHFLAIGFSYLCFLVTQLFYLTFVLPRYIMLQYFYLVIVLAFVLNELAINEKILRWIMIVSTCVLLFQNFYNIDLISHLIFDTLNTGKGYMLFDNPLYVGGRNEFITYKDGKVPYIQPYGMTNKQFSYFDKILEKAIGEIEYTDGDLLILPLCFNNYEDNFYWGNHLDLYYYDTKNKCFVLLVNECVPVPDDIVKLEVVQVSEKRVFRSFTKYNRVFYFDFSFSEDIDKFVHEFYQTELVENLEYRGWTLGIYQMERRD